MKNFNKILLAAALTAAFGLANQAKAANDNVAASPRAQQMINEQSAVAGTTSTASAASGSCMASCSMTCVGCQDRVAASPRVQMALDERNVPAAASTTTTLSENTAANDGMAASPRLRTQLDERAATFTVAPLK